MAQQPDPLLSKTPQLQQKWVDSVFNTLSVDQKIGQLFTPMVFSRKDTTHYQEIKTLIEKYHIGGIIFSQGGPVKQTQWLNAFQSISKVPLLISMDAEWGGHAVGFCSGFSLEHDLGRHQRQYCC